MSTLLAQLLGGILAILLVGLVLQLLRLPRRVVAAGSIAAAVAVLAGMFWLTRLPAPRVTVQLMAPSEGSVVARRTPVQGRVAPSVAEIYVLVHPLSSDVWWVQNTPLVGNDGRWQTEAYFGTDTKGVGELFEVVALATDEAAPLRLLRGTRLATGQQVRSVSPNFAKSDVVVVRRDR